MKNEMLEFRKNAKLANLCKEWDGKWAACHDDKEKLVRLVLSQQAAPYFADFCYRGKGLSKEYCKKEFGEYINGHVFNDCDGVNGFTYAMYIDTQTDLVITTDVTQLLWCNIDVFVQEISCPTLYISNGSKINLTCEGYSCVRVYLFDTSEITIADCDDTCGVTVYNYSDKAKVVQGKYSLGQIKEFRKELRL